jgi:YgiT-type zinc finger domain-containing protein
MCGSRSVRRQRVEVHLRSGKVVRDVEADVCPKCGERYYDLDAVRQVEKAWAKKSTRRRTAE